MEKEELLERYEAYGDEGVYAEARGLYERSLAGGGDARALTEFGYLQECHGRLSIRAAVSCHERAIDADPQYDKPHWQLIHAMATLGQAGQAVDRYRQRLAAAPADLRAHTAFLLEREDRLAEAAAEWRFIIGWCEERGYAISADWPRRELQRLEARLAGS